MFKLKKDLRNLYKFSHNLLTTYLICICCTRVVGLRECMSFSGPRVLFQRPLENIFETNNCSI